jgi:hypothetical protein
MPRLERQTGKLQKNHFAQQNLESLHVLSKRKPPSRILEKICPARPQHAERRCVLFRCGGPLREARTPLADVFSILQGACPQVSRARQP